MQVIKLGPQHQLHIYFCKVEHVPYLDLLGEYFSEELEETFQPGENPGKQLAKDLLDSFQDHISVNDMDCIAEECFRRIIDHWKSLKITHFRLEEPKYKFMQEYLKLGEKENV